MNKSLFTYIITFLIISLFGFKFLFSVLGNILILLFLVPILLIVLFFLVISSFKSKLKVCTNCGATMISESESCLYCGSTFSENENSKTSSDDPSSETIEIEAEEIN